MLSLWSYSIEEERRRRNWWERCAGGVGHDGEVYCHCYGDGALDWEW